MSVGVANGPEGEVRRLGRELAVLCAGLDVDSLSPASADDLWGGLDRVERLASGAKLRLARKLAESRGSTEAARRMATSSGCSRGRAHSWLRTSRALSSLPVTEAALGRGELSVEAAEVLVDAAGADPSAEARLLELARNGDLARLREECGRVKARAEDPGERSERLHRQRRLRTWSGADGSWNLSLRHTPEAGAQIEAVLAPLREAIFHSARAAGRHEAGEAYAADAAVEMARRAAGTEDVVVEDVVADTSAEDVRARDTEGSSPGEGPADGYGGADDIATEDDESRVGAPRREPADGNGGDGVAEGGRGGDRGDSSPPGAARAGGHSPPRRARRSRRPDTKVIVLIDYEALKRGWVQGEERCEIAGVGPVSVATAKGLMGDAFGAAVVRRGVDVYAVAHLGRSATAHQRSALEARGYCCEVPGCGNRRGLEIDHVENWHGSWRTKLDLLAWLCPTHHADKTQRGARLSGPPGARRWHEPKRGARGRDRPQANEAIGGGTAATTAGARAADEAPPTADTPRLFAREPAA